MGLVTSALRRLHLDEDGISLVEMIVAIFVVGIILTAMASTAIASLHAQQTAERVTRSTALGNEVLERLQAIPYGRLGLYSTEGTSHFGGASFAGADLVLLADESPEDADVPEPEETVSRDGIEYTIQTAVVWVDDAADGTGGADPDGVQDYKRLIIDVTWELGGQTRARRVEGLRSPAPGDQPLSVAIMPDVVALEADGVTQDAFTIFVFAQEPQIAINVSYKGRDGFTNLANMVPTSSDQREWKLEFLAGTQQFPNGETLFVIKGTSSVGSVETTTVGRALFLHDLNISSITTLPVQLEVQVIDEDLSVVSPCESELQIDTDVDGAIASDAVEATVDGIGPRAMSVTGTDVEGTQFELLMETSTLVLTPGIPVSVEVNAQRTVGTVATTTATLEVPVQAVEECA